MAMDYVNKLYWPPVKADALGETRTTYGKTIARTAHLQRHNLIQERHCESELNERTSSMETRPGSRMLHRRLPPITASSSKDQMYQQYRMNRLRSMQSQVPMARTVCASRQQNSVRSAPNIGTGYQNRKEMKDMRLRQGRAGGTWRHAKEVLQSKGENMMYIDGVPCLEDKIRELIVSHSQPTKDNTHQQRQCN